MADTYTMIICINIEVNFSNSIERSTARLKEVSKIILTIFTTETYQHRKSVHRSDIWNTYHWIWETFIHVRLQHSLDIFIMFTKLLIIKTKLIHKVGGHLLNLVIRERLKAKKSLNAIQSALRSLNQTRAGYVFVASYLLDGQIIGEGALHVIIFTRWV